jgi:hypothetical protein
MSTPSQESAGTVEDPAAPSIANFLDESGVPGIPTTGDSHERPAARGESRDATASDLARIAASVHWVQLEEAAARLRRESELRRASALVPIEPGAQGQATGSAVNLRRRSLRGPLTILAASISILMGSILAAPIVYHSLLGSWNPGRPAMASLRVKSVAPSVRASTQEASPTISPRDDDARPAAPGDISREGSNKVPATASFARATAALPPGTQGTEQASSATPVRARDPSEITLLVRQGEQFIAAGDVLAARISFERAAEAGDAEAALALGATYDPSVLAKLGVVGMRADQAKAQGWYAKAQELRSLEPTWRLEPCQPAFPGC